MPFNNEVINTEQTVQAQDALITCTVQGFVRFKWVKKQTKPSCGSRYRTYVRIQIHTSGSRYKRPDPDTYVRIQIQTSGSRYKRPDPDTNVRIQIHTSRPRYKRPDRDTYVRTQTQTSGSRYKRPDPDTYVRTQVNLPDPDPTLII